MIQKLLFYLRKHGKEPRITRSGTRYILLYHKMSDLMKFKEIRILTNLGYPCNFCMRKNYELPISIVWKMLSTLTSDEFAIEQYSSTLLGTYSLNCSDTLSTYIGETEINARNRLHYLEPIPWIVLIRPVRLHYLETIP